MKKFKALLFDLDGTLLNTLEDIGDSVNYILKKYGYPLRTYEEIRSFVGNGSERLIELSLPGGRTNPDFASCHEEYKAYYLNHNNIKTSPYEGIGELLEELSLRNYKLAIVSNKNGDNTKSLNKIYFDAYIKTAIGTSENLRRKPAPDMVCKALNELGASIEDALYIGDSEVDIYTAQNAKIPCLSVCWGFRDREYLKDHGAEYIIDHPYDLLEFLGEEGVLKGAGI